MLEPTRAASKTISEMSSIEKAAIVLVALGKEVSSQVIRNLPDVEIEPELRAELYEKGKGASVLTDGRTQLPRQPEIFQHTVELQARYFVFFSSLRSFERIDHIFR